MEIRLIEDGDKDLAYWQKSHNSVVLKRIAELLASIEKNPTQGIGNPEPLRHKPIRILVKANKQDKRACI